MSKIETLGLFDGRYWPSTAEIGFLEIDPGVAADFYAKWQQRLQAERGGSAVLTERSTESGFSGALESLLPLTSVERRRIIFVPTSSQWCAYLDNGWQGSDAFSVVSYLSRQLSCRGVKFRYQPHTAEKSADGWVGIFGATILEIYGPERTEWLNTVRSIFTSFDMGKWQFGAQGAIQNFEDVGHYVRRNIASRFNLEILDDYLNNLDINAFDEHFYVPGNAFFHVEKTGPMNPDVKNYTFDL